jgi:hypothetical protein
MTLDPEIRISKRGSHDQSEISAVRLGPELSQLILAPLRGAFIGRIESRGVASLYPR